MEALVRQILKILLNVKTLLLFYLVTPSAGSPESLRSTQLSAAHSVASACERACTSINSALSQSVYEKQTGAFEFWDAKQAEIIPACRVEPSSAGDLSYILSVVVEDGCHFAVKSGGHERTVGASNAAGGLTIDLVRLDGIEVADDKQSVTIGAGLRWIDVYRRLERDQIAVLGGRIADVGVGGFLLGGGISFFANARGIACESIISYELVLPNASIVTVDKEVHAELYSALKGPGQMNFGIVSSFTMEAFPLTNEIWGGQKYVTGKDVEDMLYVNHELVTKGMDVDPHVAVMHNIACLEEDGFCFASVAAQHTTHNSTERWPPSLQGYGEMKGRPDITSMHIGPLSTTTEDYALAETPGKHRTIYGTTSYEPSVELELRLLKLLCKEAYANRDIAGFRHGMVMHPFSAAMIARMRQKSYSALQSALPETHPLTILNVIWQWDDKADDERAYASYYRLMSSIEETAKAIGVWHPYKYINYAEATQDVWAGYGDLTALKKLQREVDPQGIFTAGGLAGGVHKLNALHPVLRKDEL